MRFSPGLSWDPTENVLGFRVSGLGIRVLGVGLRALFFFYGSREEEEEQ